ncbi:MAG: response regulator transcription factor [Bacteroidota bacterium]|nr:response regulator transcription factor [Bacteroidota bacterium]
MNKINVIVVDDHPIVSEGIEALIEYTEDIRVVSKVRDLAQLSLALRKFHVRIVLVNLYQANESDIETILSIKNKHSEVKILILSMSNEEDFILKTLKAGAKGYLSKDTYRNQLIEAIYTLQNGFEYYSKSISTVILRSYINNNGHKVKQELDLKCLTNREREVLKLFADGFGNPNIADELFISVRTVETHKTNIMQKLRLKTTVDLVKFAIRNNIIEV